MSQNIKMKQFMQVPEYCTVLSTCEDLEGKTVLWEPAREGWTYLLVLVDGGYEQDDYITFYGIDQYGIGDVDDEAKLVIREFCSSCGKLMKAHLLEEGQNGVLWYECSCGNKKTSNQEENENECKSK